MKRTVHELGKLNWGKRVYAVVVLCAAAAIALPAQTFTTLHSFDGTDGAGPLAPLAQATNGDLYGTTAGGGAYGYGGTVFKITPSGTLTTLYSFCPSYPNCPDGYEPYAGLVQATNGDLYGITMFGGADLYGPYGGTVFKITPSGTLTTLYSFCAQKPEFKRQLDAREIGFYKDDKILALLTTTQIISEAETFQSTYLIEKVLRHIHAPRQSEFPE